MMCCDRLSSPKGVVVTRKKGGLRGLTDAAVQVALVAVTWQVRPKAALRPLHGDWQAASSGPGTCPFQVLSAHPRWLPR